MLFAVSCPVCGRRGSAPCAECAALLRPAPDLPVPIGLTACAAVLSYEGVGRELVARLKYRNARTVIRPLAAAMAGLVDAGGIDLVTWAPTDAGRRRRRGFDQAELLARAVARNLRLPDKYKDYDMANAKADVQRVYEELSASRSRSKLQN